MKRSNVLIGAALVAVLAAGPVPASLSKADWYRACYDEQGVQVGARPGLRSAVDWPGMVTDRRHYTTSICSE